MIGFFGFRESSRMHDSVSLPEKHKDSVVTFGINQGRWQRHRVL